MYQWGKDEREKTMYEYRCKILKVVDGDTVDIDIDLGFGVWLHKERVRMMGIDTPESRTRDLTEKAFGLASKQFVKDHLPIGSMQVLKTEIDKSGEDAKGKFGRILGELYSFDTNINDKMVEECHAVGYHGQSKEEIAEEHLLNRKNVVI